MMAQYVRELATKADKLISVPGAHMMGEKQLPQLVL